MSKSERHGQQKPPRQRTSSHNTTVADEEIMKAEYDFSKAKRAKNVPHLAKLQAESNPKK
ncbi:MAG: hypothetical protein PHQ60_01915 [Sideroxydans sp.]|nr:hypothetical protein [Sideroxydans sp.]MDD5056598.1 hypothetical protein [Sideroxydans sp.]